MLFSILALDGCRPGTVQGICDIIDVANMVSDIANGDQAKTIARNVIAIEPKQLRTSNGTPIQGVIKASKSTMGDVVIIPGCLNHPESIETNLGSYEFAAQLIQQHHASGKIVMASCSAVFILGLAGLLDHRRATASWWAQPLLKQFFPNAIIQDNEMLTEQDGIYCAAGTFSYPSALIPLIARALGKELAALTAKYAMIDERPVSQSAYRSSEIQKRHYPLPFQIEQIVRQSLPNTPSVKEVADELGMSVRTLQRRLQTSGQVTAKEIIDRTRIAVASELIKTSSTPLPVIAEATGFVDDSSFRRAFKNVLGMPPSQYRYREKL